MINLSLNRKSKTDDSFLGELLLADQFLCYTLENLELSIPDGVFEVKMQWSDHFQRNIPHLQNVPNREAIEIHPGNTAEDFKGCIGVGYIQGCDDIEDSRRASDDLNAMLQEAQDTGSRITITINNINSTT